MSSVPERGELDDEYQWDLASMYSTDEEWEDAYDTVQHRLEDLREYEGAVTEDGSTLLAVLELRDDIMRRVQTIYAYARMRSDEDTRNQTYQSMSARAESLTAEASSAASFIEPEIQQLAEPALDDLIEEEPGLETYEFYLRDVLRLKDHTRSSEIESLLSDLSDVVGAGSDIYTTLMNADMTFPTVETPDGETVEITQSNLVRLLRNPDRKFRQTVHEDYYDELNTIRNTVGEALDNTVRTHVKLARAHEYDSARAAALDEPNIPETVYDTLVNTIRGNLDALHRHIRIKRRALDVEEFRMWDVYTPMTDSESPDVSYQQATEYLLDALEPLGEAYVDRVAEGIESRWIDVYENRGKRSGAYSFNTYDEQPFVLMNWQDEISSMYTLAHELGHSLHAQLTSEHQPYIYSNYETFTAEVASTVHESLLTNHLLETVDDERFRRHVLVEQLERIRSTLFRQTLFAEFEHEIHTTVEEGGALTPDDLDDRYEELKAAYYAPARIDDRIAREWMRIAHFFRYEYYVFQYATGISAALAIVDDILEQGEPAADRYLTFLQQGGHGYPLDLLESAGVDMTTADPIEAALDRYRASLDDIERTV